MVSISVIMTWPWAFPDGPKKELKIKKKNYVRLSGRLILPIASIPTIESNQSIFF